MQRTGITQQLHAALRAAQANPDFQPEDLQLSLQVGDAHGLIARTIYHTMLEYCDHHMHQHRNLLPGSVIQAW